MKVLTLTEAANRIGLSKASVSRMVKLGELKRIMPPDEFPTRDVFVDAEDLERLIAERATTPLRTEGTCNTCGQDRKLLRGRCWYCRQNPESFGTCEDCGQPAFLSPRRGKLLCSYCVSDRKRPPSAAKVKRLCSCGQPAVVRDLCRACYMKAWRGEENT